MFARELQIGIKMTENEKVAIQQLNVSSELLHKAFEYAYESIDYLKDKPKAITQVREIMRTVSTARQVLDEQVDILAEGIDDNNG